jgi:hypothetical protein
MSINSKILLLPLLAAFFLCNCNPTSTDKEGKASGSYTTITKENKSSKEEKPEKSESSEITCPHCAFKKQEILPTEVCQLVYTCTNCRIKLYPKKGDCCVFCSYGDRKCPSMQVD